LLDYTAYIIVRFLNVLFAFIPISLALWLGRRVGTIAFLINKKRRRIAYANLKAAFAKEKTPRELQLITKKVYQNMAQTFVEILNLTKVSRRYIDRYVRIDRFDRIQDAAKSGRGVILLTAHFGDWELLSLTSALVGFPISVLVREQKMKRLNELLNRLRESKGCRVIRKGMPTKNLLKALYDGQIVGILSDQDAGKEGVFVDFFNRPTSCHAGPMEMAQRTDSLVIPNFIVRKHGPYHTVFLEEPVDFHGAGDDVKMHIQRFASLLESYVRRYPDQWLWLHKRWKSTPIRTVLVLNDGKAGHLNQSLAVADKIRKARMAQGYGPEDTKIIVKDLRFRNKFARIALSACAALANWRCHGCMRCMKLCLERESYEALMGTYAEFVVSCGSSLAAANVLMAIENNAKNVVVMKPDSLIGADKFALSIIPRHDHPRLGKRILATIVAPNLMDENVLKSDAEKLKAILRSERRPRLGLLIGGDNPEFALTREIGDALVNNVLKICDETGASFLVTTSRRTPPHLE
jgi:KDO2-lipid IV(A) lauroyltransferase